MKYQITSPVQSLTSAKGNNYKKFSVKDEKGVVTQDICAFTSYGAFGGLTEGATVEGLISEKEYNGRKSYSLVDGNLGAKPQGFGGGFGAGAMKAKTESITKAMDRKEDSIMISSTARDATLILSTFFKETQDYQTKWLQIRAWLVTQWENTTAKGINSSGTPVPFDDFSPF